MYKQKQCRHNPIATMINANLSSWLRSPRTIIMLIAIVLLCHIEISRSIPMLKNEDILLNWFEMPYKMLESGVNILMSSIIFFVMMSELPRQMNFQNNMLIRSSRKRWLTAQIFYSFLLIFIVLVLLIACVLIFSLGQFPMDNQWSDTARIADGMPLDDSLMAIPTYVRERFTPLTSIVYASMPIIGFWLSMSMVILLCSLLGSQFIGVLICAFAMLAHFVGSYPLPYPIEFAIVQNMNPDFVGPSMYWKTLGTYAVLNTILIGVMFFRIHKTDLVFYAGNKQ
ncbi:MAG: hypothetical protein VB099_06800 [Candidatus Limiplasma sp.]|nr:hypothetical protein [Candidatus Limiplasma sp.]